MRRVRAMALALALAALPLFAQAQESAPDDLAGRLRIVSMRAERLADLAKRNDLGMLQVLVANPTLDFFKAQSREHVVLPTAHLLPDAPRKGIVVNRADYRLYYFENGTLVLTAPVGLGQTAFETPLGETMVVRKAINPVWRPTAGTHLDFPDLPAEVPPGPDNPLGTRALYLGWPTYLIHGAPDSYSVGRRFTRGCIRLYEADVQRLYDLVPIGTPVTVVDQPVKLGWHDGELFLEAQPDFKQLEELRTGKAITVKTADYLNPYIGAKARDQRKDIDWTVVKKALAERRGIPVQITATQTHPVDITETAQGF